MLDRVQYYAALGKMRNECSTVGVGGRATNRAPNPYRYTIADFDPAITLFFSMPDFYLKGIGIGTTLYTFYGSAFTMLGYTRSPMTFGDTYANMGWDKSNNSFTVTLDMLNQAFFDLMGGQPNKAGLCCIVIAFAEGLRFGKIANKVVNGEAIAGKELDWSAPGATVIQG